MSKKLMQIVQAANAATTGKAVKVYKDQDTKEYVCQLWEHGKHHEPADYFTDSLQDALMTAYVMAQ